MGAPERVHGFPAATAHQSGTIPVTARRRDLVERQIAEDDIREGLAGHVPQDGHADPAHNGATGGLNENTVRGGKLRSIKRLRARLEAARDLDDAKRLTGLSGADLGAALDYDRKLVARILAGEAPFEVAHLRLLPVAMAAILLGRLLARLDVASRALCSDEERRVREAGIK